jgi:hypothetical protein
MRILLLNQFFYSGSGAVSQFLTGFGCGLADEGPSVWAICGCRSYAASEHLESAL